MPFGAGSLRESVKVQQLRQIVVCRRAHDGFGHGLIPGNAAPREYYQRPASVSFAYGELADGRMRSRSCPLGVATASNGDPSHRWPEHLVDFV